MNLIIFTAEDIVCDDSETGIRVAFTDSRRLGHIHKILKSSTGDHLRVGLLNGDMGEAVILEIDSKKIIFDVVLNEAPPPPSPVTLLLALPRPLVIRRILADATSFGVKKIFLFHSVRVEKSFWQSPVLESESIAAQLIKGLEQGKDTVLPVVKKCRSFKHLLEYELTELMCGYAKMEHAYVGHPGAASQLPRDVVEPTLVAIGPEGGLMPVEVDGFLANGFRCVNFGPRTLRVETAVSAVLGRLSIP